MSRSRTKRFLRSNTAPGLFSEASMALLKSSQCAQKVNLTKVRPQRLFKVELRVGTLPKQKTGKALLTRRANHQIGVRLTGGVEVIGN
jgi:hypothetical protein